MVGSVAKNLPAYAGDTGSIPGLGRSRGGRNGNPLQFSCLGSPVARGGLQSMESQSQTQLSVHPGGPVVKNPHFHCKGAQVQSLVGELRSPHATQHSQKHK